MRHNLFFFAPPDDSQNSYGNNTSNTPNNSTNTPTGAGSSSTPFDQSLLHDPAAPRDTQPLSPINPANTVTPAATPPTTSPRTLPPQVLPGARVTHPSQNLSNDDDDTTQPPIVNKPTRKLPTSTLVGMSMAGGAVAVLIISLLVRNVIPSPKTPDSQTPDALPPATIDIKQQPGIVMTPDGETSQTTPGAPSQNARTSQNENSSPEVTITPDDTPASSADIVENSGDEESGGNSSEATQTPNNRTASGSPQRSASTQNNNRDLTSNRSSSRNERTSQNTERPTRNETPENRTTRDRVVNGRWTSANHGYSIAPPEGFSLRRTGRRTAWRGPNGSELLVEVGSANGSPREGWERLDRDLSKKYGSKYRNRGIREVIINGKDAAIWEFDLDTRSGTVRKIDVAMHDGKRGYAVLGSAPVENFDAVRSQIESAVNSFRIESAQNRSNAAPTRRDDDSENDDNSEGY